MAEEKNTPQLTLSVKELQQLIAAAVSQSQESSAKIIADALIEARKPYVDPRVEQNNQMMREQQKELHERIKRDIEASRENCPHMQGCNALSEVQGQLSAFVMHQTDTGVVFGICTNCQKDIWSNKPEDRKFFSMKSANKMSRAGQRTFMDYNKAQQWTKQSQEAHVTG